MRQPVIIFGAGIVGEVLFHACKKFQINIECFCDNNINKTKKKLCGLEVIHTPKLKYRDPIFIISSADIHDAIDQLRSLGYKTWYSCTSFLRDYDIYKRQYSLPANFVEYAVNTAILCQDSYLSPKKLFMRSVDIIITERCSLRCKDCSNLMRHYKNPKDCDTKKLMKEIDQFCDVIDEINEFRVLGGEPFMNKDVHVIIKRLIDEPKASKVVIYTNGTIVPREEQIKAMRSDKVLFIITDYGKLSRNITELAKKLSANSIQFYIQKVGGWTDCSKIEKHSRSPKAQKEIFQKCCAKNTFTLSDGKLFRCPFSANANRLNAFPAQDYVDIFSNDSKEKIKALILNKSPLASCDYCSGRSFDDPEIVPAIQEI